RHRGSTLLKEACGEGLRKITCPYHAWTYGIEGALRAFPGAEPGFDDVDKASHGLIELPVAERYGLIFAKADPHGTPFTVDEALHRAEEELAHSDLGGELRGDRRPPGGAVHRELVVGSLHD